MNTAATGRAKMPVNDDLQTTLQAWDDEQSALAADANLSLLLIEGHQPPQLTTALNNSICHSFQTSPTHAHLCDPFCGDAFARAQAAAAPTHYRCHAGLNCFTMPVDLTAEQNLAVIGGRAFFSVVEYRALVERFRDGDLRDLGRPELLSNVIFSTPYQLEALSLRVSEAATRVRANKALRKSPPADDTDGSQQEGGGETQAQNVSPKQPPDNFAANTSLVEACRLALQTLIESQQLTSVALMLRQNGGFFTSFATGKFTNTATGIEPATPEYALPRAANIHELHSTVTRDEAAADTGDELFPLLVGDEIKGALIVGDSPLDETKRVAIRDYCARLALPLEVLRLREELERSASAAHHVRDFTARLNEAAPNEPYAAILRHSAALLRSERGSLLLYDEAANELEVRAAVGPRAAFARDARIRLGEGVAGAVLNDGRPLVVRDVRRGGNRPAPAERNYKSDSFISYPIITGGRKVGVINVTDKAGGGAYNELDLGLLELITPQVVLALDRADWQEKATQFQLLSITDPLTGLLNRRYLEERVAEELERSKRHRFAMSFLMLDIDNFKDYNDRHGHQAGDTALELTAQCLKSALRSEDVAARYGGEEFSILLPQTSSEEAYVIAERIRRRVERTHFTHGQQQPYGAVTVSIGISSFAPQVDLPARLIGAADQALYHAKRHGRNRVEVYTPTADHHALTPGTGDPNHVN